MESVIAGCISGASLAVAVNLVTPEWSLWRRITVQMAVVLFVAGAIFPMERKLNKIAESVATTQPAEVER